MGGGFDFPPRHSLPASLFYFGLLCTHLGQSETQSHGQMWKTETRGENLGDYRFSPFFGPPVISLLSGMSLLIKQQQLDSIPRSFLAALSPPPPLRTSEFLSLAIVTNSSSTPDRVELLSNVRPPSAHLFLFMARWLAWVKVMLKKTQCLLTISIPVGQTEP